MYVYVPPLPGFKTCKGARCVVLLPEGRVSDVQRRQMTTVQADHIHCVSVRGDFDDCQRLLKEAFANPCMRERHKLLAVNSVNFGRIVCQMVYYFWSCFRAREIWSETNPTFSVPTGNFGNLLVSYIFPHKYTSCTRTPVATIRALVRMSLSLRPRSTPSKWAVQSIAS